MNSKKAIVIVSVGTTHLDVLDKTSNILERKAALQYPDYEVCQAFCSQRILKMMEEKKPGTFFDVETVLDRLAAECYEEVILQPTFVIGGAENEHLRETVNTYKERFPLIKKGKVLLSTKEDYIEVLDAVLETACLTEEEGLMLVGHGTKHHDNTEYQNLEYTAYTQGKRNVFVAALEGYQKTMILMRKIQLCGCKKMRLMPFLYVAGKHAKKDIAGSDNSWKTKLEEAGYEVAPQLTGLGEIEKIQDIILAHLKEAIGE